MDKLILQLYQLEAPVAVLNYFLPKISDASHRLALAKKACATKSVVDALVELKNRQELEILCETLTPGVEERFYAENALKCLVTIKTVL